MLTDQIRDHLRQALPPELYTHSAGVVQTARALAGNLGCNPDRAELAGWLHDCARHLPGRELLVLARDNNIKTDRFSLRHPVLLHAPVGAVMAERLGCTDSEVLAAIRHHTLGIPKMPLLGRIIYLADKIEPGRHYPGIEILRLQAGRNFDAALLAAAAQTISYTVSKKQAIHPLTVAFWNWLVDTSV
jgi:predicted HD superfamily hydrolase involved in NAD metabolism